MLTFPQTSFKKWTVHEHKKEMDESYYNEEEMNENMHDDQKKVMKEEEDEMDDMDVAADEGGEDLSEPADMDEPEEGNQELAKKLKQAVADIMGRRG